MHHDASCLTTGVELKCHQRSEVGDLVTGAANRGWRTQMFDYFIVAPGDVSFLEVTWPLLVRPWERMVTVVTWRGHEPMPLEGLRWPAVLEAVLDGGSRLTELKGGIVILNWSVQFVYLCRTWHLRVVFLEFSPLSWFPYPRWMMVYKMVRVDIYKMAFQDPFYTEGPRIRSNINLNMATYRRVCSEIQWNINGWWLKMKHVDNHFIETFI